MKFFAGKLKKYGVKSPSELSDEEKKKFFSEIEKDWTHDSNEEVEEKGSLGKRVKARMEAEEGEEDELSDDEIENLQEKIASVTKVDKQKKKDKDI